MNKFLWCIAFWAIAQNATAQYTAIPDSVFEQKLIEQGYDNVLDGQVLTSNINTVTTLSLSFSEEGSANNLSGIEDFIALEILAITFSQIYSIDLSFCPNLKTLLLTQNYVLSNINLTNNVNLENLTIASCSSNYFPLNISNCTKLKNIYIGNFNLMQINPGIFNDLEVLILHDVGISELDVSNNNNLRNLEIGNGGSSEIPDYLNSPISELNLSNNVNLKTLYAAGLQDLTTLNLKNNNNNNIIRVWATHNPNLSCIQVDNTAYSTTNWVGSEFWFDAGVVFSENCALNAENFSNNQVTFYPNPVTNNLHITSAIPITYAVVYNALGQKITQYNNITENINVANLATGLYFFEFYFDNQTKESIKIVKE